MLNSEIFHEKFPTKEFQRIIWKNKSCRYLSFPEFQKFPDRSRKKKKKGKLKFGHSGILAIETNL